MVNLKQLLDKIIADDELHARWLNTLSYLENCGARKIAACEHPIFVKEEMIKHAAEEFRHAHHLKRQITKISTSPFIGYTNLLGEQTARHYLDWLDVKVSRLLKEELMSLHMLCNVAYIVVTYAIEMRAATLYPMYEKILRSKNCSISVRSIVLEEEGHLEEMQIALREIPNGISLAKKACQLEEILFSRWVNAVQDAVG